MKLPTVSRKPGTTGDIAGPDPARPDTAAPSTAASISGAPSVGVPSGTTPLPRRHAADPTATDVVGTHADGPPPTAAPTPPQRRPRASLLATLGLVFGVGSAMLVLSGPLVGYGIGVAGLALVLSIAGVIATGKRHVAGKSDALLGMLLALGAIVIGVLALTGSLPSLGTNAHPVDSVRQWLDTQFVHRIRG